MYNPALGKFLSVDPLTPDYPELTPYQFASNQPIWGIDLDGLEVLIIHQEVRDFIPLLAEPTSGSGFNTTNSRAGGLVVGYDEDGNLAAVPFVSLTLGVGLAVNPPFRMSGFMIGGFINKGIYDVDELGYNFGAFGLGSKVGELNSDGSVLLFENTGANTSLFPTNVTPRKIPKDLEKKGSFGGYIEGAYMLLLDDIKLLVPGSGPRRNMIEFSDNEIIYSNSFGELIDGYFKELEKVKAKKEINDMLNESEKQLEDYNREIERYKKQLEEINNDGG